MHKPRSNTGPFIKYAISFVWLLSSWRLIREHFSIVFPSMCLQNHLPPTAADLLSELLLFSSSLFSSRAAKSECLSDFKINEFFVGFFLLCRIMKRFILRGHKSKRIGTTSLKTAVKTPLLDLKTQTSGMMVSTVNHQCDVSTSKKTQSLP